MVCCIYIGFAVSRVLNQIDSIAWLQVLYKVNTGSTHMYTSATPHARTKELAPGWGD